MSRILHKYQYTICRVAMLFLLLTGSMSVWASTGLAQNTGHGQSHCVEHQDDQNSDQPAHCHMPAKQQHDCCKDQKPCTKSCCNGCVMNVVNGIALVSSMTIPVHHQGKTFDAAASSTPDGVFISNPYRPPQTLLI